MADRRSDEDDDGEGEGGRGGRGARRIRGRQGVISASARGIYRLKSEASSPEDHHTNTEQHSPRLQDVPSIQGANQTDPSSHGSSYDLSSMGAALPHLVPTSYNRNIVHGRPRLVAGTGPNTAEGYRRSQGLSHSYGQPMASIEHFGPPFQQRGQPQVFPVSYPRGSITYYQHVQPYSQPLQHGQPQQPMVYSGMSPGYHPMQHHLPLMTYQNPPGVAFNPNQVYPTSSIAPGTAARYPGTALPQIRTVGGPSAECSPTSPTPRGPPRKPKQSGYALWCGNLPSQTNIIGLKDHFSRGATDDIESVFLISKSNCAFINYKNEESCIAALARFQDSRFERAKLVCRLRKAPAHQLPGTPLGPRSDSTSNISTQGGDDGRLIPVCARDDTERDSTAVKKVPEKFFVLKSLTMDDLATSVLSGSWATQSHNEAALNAAYKSAEHVYLVFSANKSGEYYGYARMVSGINRSGDSADTNPAPRSTPFSTGPAEHPITFSTPATEHAPRGYIIDDSARGAIFWEAQKDDDGESKTVDDEAGGTEASESDLEQQGLGHPFKIEWISTEKVPFHLARGLRNPWNQNREVKIARDGTEIEPVVGRRLVNLFHQRTLSPFHAGLHAYPSANRGFPPVFYQ